jgi:hypothetical protein
MRSPYRRIFMHNPLNATAADGTFLLLVLILTIMSKHVGLRYSVMTHMARLRAWGPAVIARLVEAWRERATVFLVLILELIQPVLGCEGTLYYASVSV